MNSTNFPSNFGFNALKYIRYCFLSKNDTNCRIKWCTGLKGSGICCDCGKKEKERKSNMTNIICSEIMMKGYPNMTSTANNRLNCDCNYYNPLNFLTHIFNFHYAIFPTNNKSALLAIYKLFYFRNYSQIIDQRLLTFLLHKQNSKL